MRQRDDEPNGKPRIGHDSSSVVFCQSDAINSPDFLSYNILTLL